MTHSKQIKRLNWSLPENMRFIPISHSQIVALASDNHPTAQHYKAISLATLCKQNLILMDSDGTDKLSFYELLNQYGIPNVKHVVSGNLNLFYELLKTGRYFSLGIKNTFANDNLLQIPLKENITVVNGLVYALELLTNFPAKMLMETISTYFNKQIALQQPGNAPPNRN